MNNKLCIIVPCFNEENTLPTSNAILLKTLKNLILTRMIDTESFILYIDDGSDDKTWNIIKELHSSNTEHIKALKLSANKGHQNAIMAGLENSIAMADMSITIDADLQDDVNVIRQMVTKHKENGCEIVYGVRKSRDSDTIFKRQTARMFYKIMDSLGTKTIFNHADYRLMGKRAMETLCEYKENNLFLRGIVPLIGYKSCCVYYDRSPRKYGTTKYPLHKMVNFAIDGITSFSTKPVRMVMTLGLVFIIFAFAIFIYTIYSYIKNEVVPGWASIILSLWFIGGCILVALGIIGEYIGKIYIEVKKRPRYHIEEKLF